MVNISATEFISNNFECLISSIEKYSGCWTSQPQFFYCTKMRLRILQAVIVLFEIVALIQHLSQSSYLMSNNKKFESIYWYKVQAGTAILRATALLEPLCVQYIHASCTHVCMYCVVKNKAKWKKDLMHWTLVSSPYSKEFFLTAWIQN